MINRRFFIKSGAAALLFPSLSRRAWAETANLPAWTETPEQRAARMQWFRDGRFGMFVHWGPYAVLGGEYQGKKDPWVAEWIQHSSRIPYREYEQIAASFNPANFDADEYVRIAKDAGMTYLVITAKHHDGFCMWDSQLTDYTIVRRTEYKRDIIRELARACRDQGLKFGLYYSVRDWHHPDWTLRYEDLGSPHQFGSRWGFPPSKWTKGQAYACGCEACRGNVPFPEGCDPRPTEAEGADMNRYLDYMKGQLTELLERYEADLMWFDAQDITDNKLARVDEMVATMRSLNPKVIISDRIASNDMAGDYGIHEGGIPGTSAPREWETCMTMNDSWGYKRADNNWKSAETLVRMLVDTTSKNGNFLLNVGPDGEGVIPEASVERLKAVGQWMRVNGESIYGCAAAPVPAPQWGKVTAKEGKLFFHIFAWPQDGALAIERFQGAARKAWLLADPAKTALEMKADGETLRVSLPPEAPDRINTVLCVETV